MKKTLGKIYKSFNYTISIKKIGAVVFTIFLFFAFNDRISAFIEKFLFIKPDFSNTWLDLLIIVASLLTFLFIGFRYVKYKYLPSFTEIYFATLVSFSVLFFYLNSSNLGWSFHKDNLITTSYIWYLVIPLFLFLFLFVIILIKRHFINPFKLDLPDNNEFKNDDPIFKIDDDKLGYAPIVSRLSGILVKEKFKKSFSIGLVGPWGNGKSSVINLLKKNIESKEFLNGFNDIEKPIVVHFLPYLNHKEDDIINEFFIALSSKLSTYNGKLSNQIVNYSQKLTDLYQNQNILSLVDKHVSKISETPAKELYDDINKRLEEIGKKIVVFVDDLDRLNDKEILQVLKLIRNTADFHNTVFVVAMDKQYVLGRLTNNSSILNSNFVDKFFQLEVFLPEIEKKVLKNYVFDVLKDSLGDIEPTFESKLSNTFNNNKNLFDDYVKNFRDAKRIINQMVYDYRNFGTEIDLKDFMNFTYFKLKFPRFIKLLNENRFDYLEVDSSKGLYNLKEVEKDNNTQDTFEILRRFNNIKSNDYSELKKYELYKKFKADEDDFESLLNIDNEDRLLLIKTLAYLFGRENIDNNYNSIRKENNFRMLMQQRVFENVLTESEFEEILENQNIERINNKLTELYSQNRINQLINRFEYFTTKDDDKLNTVLVILLQLYDKRGSYNIAEIETLNLIGKLMHLKLELNPNEVETIANWVKENVFESQEISIINKINLLNKLWESKHENQCWKLTKDYILAKAKSLIDEYLEHIETPWKVNNFEFYGVFHDLKNMPTVKEHLIMKFKEFWSKNEIELLCAQTLHFGSFSVSSYNVSDFENEIFGNKEAFYQFVKTHRDKDKPEVKEFLEFLELCSITHFNKFLKFNFIKSDMVLQRIENHKKQYGGRALVDDDFNNITQIIFETNNKELFDTLRQNNELFKLNNFSVYDNDGLYHLLINFNTVEFNTQIDKFTDKIKEILSSTRKIEYKKENILKKENFIILDDKDIYLKVISNQ